MKPIFSILALATLALAGCAPTAAISTPSPTPTEIIVPTPTATPLPPTATATAIPNALENKQGQALLGLGYEQAQLKEFTSFAEGEYSFPGDTVTYHGIIGTKADGSKEILAFKFSDNPNLIKLSGTEVVELSKKTCTLGQCFSQFTWGDEREPITFIDAVTTGIVLSDDKKDETGNVIASAQSLLMLTMDDRGNPRFLKMVVQVKDPANPNENLLKNGLLNSLGFVTEDSTKASSQQELAEFFHEGIQIEFGIQKIEFIGGGKVVGWSFFKDTFGADPSYQSALESFLLKNGLLQTGNDSIIILPSTNSN